MQTGKLLDAQAARLAELLVQAEVATVGGNEDGAVEAVTQLAEIIFQIPPFRPDELPGKWRDVLAAWLKGQPVRDVPGGDTDEVLQFIESGLSYRLTWGMEAVRVRGLAHGDLVERDLTLVDFELGAAVAAVETGSLHRSAALLMRSGFGARSAAIKAACDTGADFATEKCRGLRQWLDSEAVRQQTEDGQWPTAGTHELWTAFVRSMRSSQRHTWKRSSAAAAVRWTDDEPPPPGTPLRVAHDAEGHGLVLTADCQLVGTLEKAVNVNRERFCCASLRETRRNLISEIPQQAHVASQ